MFYRPFDRSMGLWISKAFFGKNCIEQDQTGSFAKMMDISQVALLEDEMAVCVPRDAFEWQMNKKKSLYKLVAHVQ